MKRTATILILTVAVLIAAACSNTATSTQKGDPRDALIKNAIKQAAGTTNPMELYNLFAGHPEMSKDMPMAGKLWVMANIIGSVNAHDLDLSRMKDIKLKAPAPSKSPNKWYCLSGTFAYAGPARLGNTGKTEISEGMGQIQACTRDGKNGPYLNSIEFKLDQETIRTAWAKIDAQKKAAKNGRTK